MIKVNYFIAYIFKFRSTIFITGSHSYKDKELVLIKIYICSFSLLSTLKLLFF